MNKKPIILPNTKMERGIKNVVSLNSRLHFNVVVNLLVLSLFALYPFDSLSQNLTSWQFSIDNGLSQNTVHTILKDSRGFIWIGTQDGLNRYDGVGVYSIMEGENKHHNLMNGTVTSLVEDVERDKLYICTNGGGLSVFDYKTEKLNHYTYLKNEPSIISDYLSDIALDDEGLLWIASSHGLSVFNPLTEKFTNYEYQEGNNFSSPGVTVMSVLITSNNEVWLGTYGRGIVKFDKKTKRFLYYYNSLFDENSGNANIISKITEGIKGDILVASDDGLHRFSRKDSVYSLIAYKDVIVKSVVQSDNGDIWIGTSGKGLARIDDKGTITNYGGGNSNLVTDDFVVNVYVDDRNHLWVGTKSNGLFHINLDGERFENLTEGISGEGVYGKSVYALAEDDEGFLWIGTNKGLTKWNIKTGTFDRVYVRGEGEDFSVWALMYEKPGFIWIGTSSGLYKYNSLTSDIKHYRYVEKDLLGIPDKEVYSIGHDKLNRLWVGTGMGLARLDETSDTFTRYYYGSNNNDLCSSVVWNVFSDSKGRFWISTYGGLNLYNFDSDDFKSLYHFEKDSTSLSSNFINSVQEDSQGGIWACTSGGANLLDDSLSVIRRIDASKGLNNSHAYRLHDVNDQLWVSTNVGLSCYDLVTDEVVNYDLNDGIQSNEFNNASILMKDGRLAYGGINGVTIFDPRKIVRSDFEPPIYFTSLQLYDNTMALADTSKWHNRVINKSVINADRIEFDSDERFFRLDFASLDYDNPIQIEYYYRMLPNSKNWIPLGKQRHLTFINLAPGTYKLEIRSSNSDRVLCNNARLLTIVVKPPWWFEMWFVFLASVLVLFSVFFLVRYRIHKLGEAKQVLEELVENRTREIEIQRNIAQKHRDEIAVQKSKLEDFAKDLEQKVKERTNELEKSKVAAEESDRLKTAFLSNMSHEIRTPMNAIIGFSELLLDVNFDENERMEFAKMIKSNGDTLLHLLNDIIDISMIESSQLKISTSRIVVKELMEEVYNNFLNSSDFKTKKELRFVIDTPSNNITIESDEFRLKQILNNLVSNALKFTHKGYVKMGFTLEGEYINFYVEDTGVGIDKVFQKQIFERFLKVKNDVSNLNRGNGLGLTITKNLVQLLKGAISLTSDKGKGSRFSFKLPLN